MSLRREGDPFTELDWAEVHARLNRLAWACGEEQPLSPREVAAVLQARARKLAAPLPAPPAPADICELLSFELVGEQYAVPAEYVVEVLVQRDLTPIPGLPEFYLGIFNYRGQVLPAIDPARLLGLRRQERPSDGHLVLVEADGVRLALASDSHTLLLRVAAQDIQPAPAASPLPLEGLTPSLVAILAVEALVRDRNIVIEKDVS